MCIEALDVQDSITSRSALCVEECTHSQSRFALPVAFCGRYSNGRVLRHALVKVSMGPGPKDENLEPAVENSEELSTSLDPESPTKEV